jgi:hypothetical protein
MPTPRRRNKDLKRLVRSRMQKTGESYTTARNHLLARRADSRTTTTPSAPRGDLAQLAGMRDAVMVARTGRSWAEWLATLDAAGAAAMNHTQIAAMVHERFGVPSWWAQGVTVGYERMRGRRSKNQVAGGNFAVSKSRTFAVPLAALAKAFLRRARAQWLEAPPARERKTTAKVVRWVEAGGAWVDVFLLAKGAAKSTANVQVSRLASRGDVDAQRATWAERLDALAAWLAARCGTATRRATAPAAT